MFSSILPPGIVHVAMTGDMEGAFLLQEEAAVVAGATTKRQRAFAAGRTCARSALATLGQPPAPLLRGSGREPLWPDGVVGSITHCTDFCAAALGHRTGFAAIGIDAEPHAPLPAQTESLILGDVERAWITHARHDLHWDRIVFSIKECVYKVWYPAMRTWLGFADVTVVLGPDMQTATVDLLHAPLVVGETAYRQLHARFRVVDGLIVAAIVL